MISPKANRNKNLPKPKGIDQLTKFQTIQFQSNFFFITNCQTKTPHLLTQHYSYSILSFSKLFSFFFSFFSNLYFSHIFLFSFSFSYLSFSHIFFYSFSFSYPHTNNNIST